MRRTFLKLGVFSVAAAWWPACGLDVTGRAGVDPSPALPDLSADAGPLADASSTPEPDAMPVEAAVDGAVDAEARDATVTLAYGSCPTFAACGGDPTGRFEIAAGCVEAIRIPQCPELSVASTSLRIRGTVDIHAATLSRTSEVGFRGKLAFPKVCIERAPDGLRNCNALATGITLIPGGPMFDKATCVGDGAGGCECDVTDDRPDDARAAYLVDGRALITTDGDRYEFCEESDGGPRTVTYADTTIGGLFVGRLVLTER